MLWLMGKKQNHLEHHIPKHVIMDLHCDSPPNADYPLDYVMLVGLSPILLAFRKESYSGTVCAMPFASWPVLVE
jgi:hypothetical protein